MHVTARGDIKCHFRTFSHPWGYLPVRGWESDEELGRYLVQNAAPLHIPDQSPEDEQWWNAECVHTFKDKLGAQWVEVSYPEIEGCPRANMRVTAKHGVRRYLPSSPMEEAVKRPITWVFKDQCTATEWQAFSAQRQAFHHPPTPEASPGPQDVREEVVQQQQKLANAGQSSILSHGTLTSVHHVQEQGLRRSKFLQSQTEWAADKRQILLAFPHGDHGTHDHERAGGVAGHG